MARRNKRRVRNNAVEGDAGVATHYFELTSSSQSSLASFYLRYGSALVATATYQTTNLEEVAADSSTTGDWYTETAVTIDAAASSAAGKTYHVGNDGALRKRLVVVVTTGGALDIATCEIEQ